MAFPTGTFTGASGNLDAMIPKIWGAMINDFAKDKQHMATFFTNRSSELSDGGNIVYTPTLTEMSAYAKSNATTVTLNAPTDTNITLTVNVWKEVSFAVEDGDWVKLKKSWYIMEKYGKNAGYTAANVLEDALITLFSNFTTSVGASTTGIADSDVRKAIGIIEANTKEDVQDGNIWFFLDTKVFWRDIAGNTVFQLNTNSPVNDPVSKRPMMAMYGVPVKLSNRLKYVDGISIGRINAIAHKDAIHYATSPLPGQGAGLVRVQTNYIPQYLSTVTTADLQYGVINNRTTYGVQMLSSVA
ncbi:MAG: hypothetical protein WCN88_04795 [Candidatus Falkowbacteria bacterium]